MTRGLPRLRPRPFAPPASAPARTAFPFGRLSTSPRFARDDSVAFAVIVALAMLLGSSFAASPESKNPAAPVRLDEATALPNAEAKKAAEAGIAAFAKGDLDRARTAFEKLLGIAPDNLTGLVNLGLISYRLGRDEEAEKLLKKVLRLNPDIAAAWLTLGLCQQRLGKPDAALASGAQAIVLEPGNARAHASLAVTLVTKGWMSGAEAELQRAIEIEPDFGSAHFNLALLYLQRSPPAVELARRHYQKALDLGENPDPEVEKKLAAAP